jgi:hypothetical protein
MNRAFWFAAGAGAGVYALTKARRVAETLTPDGLADRLAGVSVGLRLFGDEVRAGMADKENDVRERLGVRLPEGPRRRVAELEEPPADAFAERPDATREGTH